MKCETCNGTGHFKMGYDEGRMEKVPCPQCGGNVPSSTEVTDLFGMKFQSLESENRQLQQEVKRLRYDLSVEQLLVQRQANDVEELRKELHRQRKELWDMEKEKQRLFLSQSVAVREGR